MDHVSAQKRSEIMRSVKAKHTKPELVLRSELHQRGFRFRLHQRTLPGTPDVVLRKHNAVVFVQGCYWHRHNGCAYATMPKSQVDFWTEKFRRNIERDNATREKLLSLGWRVAVVWQCGLKRRVRDETMDCLAEWLRGPAQIIETPLLSCSSSPERQL